MYETPSQHTPARLVAPLLIHQNHETRHPRGVAASGGEREHIQFHLDAEAVEQSDHLLMSLLVLGIVQQPYHLPLAQQLSRDEVLVSLSRSGGIEELSRAVLNKTFQLVVNLQGVKLESLIDL